MTKTISKRKNLYIYWGGLAISRIIYGTIPKTANISTKTKPVLSKNPKYLPAILLLWTLIRLTEEARASFSDWSFKII